MELLYYLLFQIIVEYHLVLQVHTIVRPMNNNHHFHSLNKIINLVRIDSSFLIFSRSYYNYESDLKYPPGFCKKNDKSSKTVIFRCILPVGIWYKSNHKQPRVYMSFSHKDLGEWKNNFGPGQIEKYVIKDSA